MFSVIIAWVVFVFVSFCIPFWIYERMTLPAGIECNWPKIIVFLVSWFVSGVYLFG